MAEADLYFESAAMILTLITVGKTLEAHSKGKTTDALRSLMQLSPKTARLERNGEEVVVPAEEVVLGDIFLVRPGDSIPVDGVVLSGASAVNESALTGESLPVDKAENDKVSAGTINQSGFLRCRATGVGEDTALSQIIRMVSDAAATKAPIAKTADQGRGGIRADGDRHRSRYHYRLAARRADIRIRARARHICARYQLPVCARACHAGRHYGRQRRRREKRHSLQNGGFA